MNAALSQVQVRRVESCPEPMYRATQYVAITEPLKIWRGDWYSGGEFCASVMLTDRFAKYAHEGDAEAELRWVIDSGLQERYGVGPLRHWVIRREDGVNYFEPPDPSNPRGR